MEKEPYIKYSVIKEPNKWRLVMTKGRHEMTKVETVNSEIAFILYQMADLLNAACAEGIKDGKFRG